MIPAEWLFFLYTHWQDFIVLVSAKTKIQSQAKVLTLPAWWPTVYSAALVYYQEGAHPRGWQGREAGSQRRGRAAWFPSQL